MKPISLAGANTLFRKEILRFWKVAQILGTIAF